MFHLTMAEHPSTTELKLHSPRMQRFFDPIWSAPQTSRHHKTDRSRLHPIDYIRIVPTWVDGSLWLSGG